LPAGLLDRLAGLPMSAQLPPPLSGLPTTLDPNGVPVFVAYRPEPNQPGVRPERQADSDGPLPADRSTLEPTDRSILAPADRSALEPAAARPAHRRVLLPVSILASAAAVVAAGTIGGNVGSLSPAVDQPNFTPGLASVQQATNTGQQANTGQQSSAGQQAGSVQQVGILAQRSGNSSFAFGGPVIQPVSMFMPVPLRPMP